MIKQDRISYIHVGLNKQLTKGTKQIMTNVIIIATNNLTINDFTFATKSEATHYSLNGWDVLPIKGQNNLILNSSFLLRKRIVHIVTGLRAGTYYNFFAGKVWVSSEPVCCPHVGSLYLDNQYKAWFSYSFDFLKSERLSKKMGKVLQNKLVYAQQDKLVDYLEDNEFLSIVGLKVGGYHVVLGESSVSGRYVLGKKTPTEPALQVLPKVIGKAAKGSQFYSSSDLGMYLYGMTELKQQNVRVLY